MKVVHFAAGGIRGGAARGMLALHQGLVGIGVDSRVLTDGRVPVDSENLRTLATTSFAKARSMAIPRIDGLLVRTITRQRARAFSTGLFGASVLQEPEYRSADVVHLHWINGLVSLRSLSSIKKPIVWTLRDFWPITAGCHYPGPCVKYKHECGACPAIKSATKYDLAWFTHHVKKRRLGSKIAFVAISRWLAEEAQAASITAGHQVHMIPNCIDTTTFSPVSKRAARLALGLPLDVRVVVTGCLNLSDPVKGVKFFVKSLRCLSGQNIFAATFGAGGLEIFSDLKCPVRHFGSLNDDISLRLLYSAADVVVVPSLEEAFGKTAAESMACGTPVVCFDKGGPSEIVDHMVNGYKAAPENINDLAAGISWVLALDRLRYRTLCRAAVDKARRAYNPKDAAQKYLELYKSVLVSRGNVV